MFKLDNIVRANIKALTPYSSARDEFKGEADIFLDANENSLGSAIKTHSLNRYPDPLQLKVKAKIGKMKGVNSKNIFLGNGSDEAIDILIRAFCNPGKDNIIILPPTYGMYEVAARINDVGIKSVNLTKDFKLDVKGIEKAINKNTKLIFVCSPNNPTGTIVDKKDIKKLLKSFDGIVVVDEAYIDFADSQTMLSNINKHPNLVILQTFSKAWGMAGLRVGMAFSSAELINIMNKIKAPYNVGELAQSFILQALEKKADVSKMVKLLKQERSKLEVALSKFNFVRAIMPSQANFLLVKTSCADKLYNFLISNNVVVRNRSTQALCEGGLRFTIGTPVENKKLLSLLRTFEKTYKA
ncbi:MAG TPA: histidinol-phosphate transaminase [Bacteroidia bacterium]|jgi:histidinol-phosphate aminotransferase|nr:histidinol-phosphate transaminase [Bacteroidia bacterium]